MAPLARGAPRYRYPPSKVLRHPAQVHRHRVDARSEPQVVGRVLRDVRRNDRAELRAPFSPKAMPGSLSFLRVRIAASAGSRGDRLGHPKPETLGKGSRVCVEKPLQNKASQAGTTWNQSQTVFSWNQIRDWLLEMDLLRRAMAA